MKNSKSRVSLLACVLGLAGGPSAQASFLDLTSLTPGSFGEFAGMLNGVSVSGSIVSANQFFSISPDGTAYGDSTIDGMSPQYSYCTVFSPCTPRADTVGYASQHNDLPNYATIAISLGSPVSNPIFHVSGLDAMRYDFSQTIGLQGLKILSGNGDGHDGLSTSGPIVFDAGPSSDTTPPDTPPPMVGSRSAWGSVKLLGTFSSLTITVSQDGRGDSGSFTLSTSPVPEPAAWLLMALGLAAVSVHSRTALRSGKIAREGMADSLRARRRTDQLTGTGLSTLA